MRTGYRMTEPRRITVEVKDLPKPSKRRALSATMWQMAGRHSVLATVQDAEPEADDL